MSVIGDFASNPVGYVTRKTLGPVVNGVKDITGMNDAAKRKQAAGEQAATDYNALGSKLQNYYGEGLGRELGQYGDAQGAISGLYGEVPRGAYGELRGAYANMSPYFNDMGPVESLYAQRQAGGDPYFNYMSDQINRNTANQWAARGMLNSGPALEANARAQAQLAAMQAQQQAGLAEAASGERAGRFQNMFGDQGQLFGASQSLFGDTQNIAQMQDQLAAQRAGAISGMYQQGGNAMTDTEKNAIAARLAAAGVPLEVSNSILGGGVQLATAGIGATSGARRA